MKKFDSVYMLEIRLLIYKYLLLFAAMTAAYIIMFYTKGLKYAGFGFDMVMRFARFGHIAGISYAVVILLFVVGSIYYYQKSAYRFRLLGLSIAGRTVAGVLAAFTLLVLWYAVTIADIFVVAWLFVKNPAYTGGPQGINFSLLVSEITRFLVPFRQPLVFLRYLGILFLVGIGCNVPVFIYELVSGNDAIANRVDKFLEKQIVKSRNREIEKKKHIEDKSEKKNKGKKLAAFFIPGDNYKYLITVYSMLMILLTGLGSVRAYCGRFEQYYEKIGDVIIRKFRVRGTLWMETSYFYKAIDNVFVGTTIFIVICLLLIARNYYYFHKDSKSIYLMKRIADTGELHRRCLSFPVTAILMDLAITFILLFIYYLFYMYNIGVNGYFNLWEVFI